MNGRAWVTGEGGIPRRHAEGMAQGHNNDYLYFVVIECRRAARRECSVSGLPTDFTAPAAGKPEMEH
jgi:hypothetical protein